MRNAEPAVSFIRQELNQTHTLFVEQQPHDKKERLDQGKENQVRFKRMSKSPLGSQKPKVFKTGEDDGSGKKRPALAARRSLALEDMSMTNTCHRFVNRASPRVVSLFPACWRPRYSPLALIRFSRLSLLTLAEKERLLEV